MVTPFHTPRGRCGSAPCHRIVASRLPTIHLFERVADPADWDALYALESLTNPRIRNEIGELRLVPVADRVSGPNASIVMAPFTHLSPQGTRFTDGHFGAYYAAESLDTAIAETRFHRENFLRATSQPRDRARDALLSRRRRLRACTTCAARRIDMPDVYDPSSYQASQKLGRELREAGSNGIAFDSVRREGGECVADLPAAPRAERAPERAFALRLGRRTRSATSMKSA